MDLHHFLLILWFVPKTVMDGLRGNMSFSYNKDQTRKYSILKRCKKIYTQLIMAFSQVFYNPLDFCVLIQPSMNLTNEILFDCPQHQLALYVM